MALAKADPTGETIKSMMRWVCEGLMPEQVHRKSTFFVIEFVVLSFFYQGLGCALVLSMGVVLW